jgi:hypothetical protein
MKERINYIVAENNNYNKEVHRCSSCKKTFKASERKEKQVELYGLDKTEKVCPHCGSISYGLVNYPITEEELLYKNFIHRNCDKKLNEALDKLTDEIIAEDMQKYNERILIKSINSERMAMA